MQFIQVVWQLKTCKFIFIIVFFLQNTDDHFVGGMRYCHLPIDSKMKTKLKCFMVSLMIYVHILPPKAALSRCKQKKNFSFVQLLFLLLNR